MRVRERRKEIKKKGLVNEKEREIKRKKGVERLNIENVRI